MPQSETLPKERDIRKRHARSIRRSLSQITPSTSHSQSQCLLFSTLPAELRLLIFQLVLSQTHDPSHPIDNLSVISLNRPSHTCCITTSTALLLTCRLVYYEARFIPLRSATHHFRYMPRLRKRDRWVQRMTPQSGAEVYHLHYSLVESLGASTLEGFTNFLLPHLAWKRITWTVSAYTFPTYYWSGGPIEQLAETLAEVVLPTSCCEVTLEMETREELGGWWEEFLEQAKKCRALDLVRKDGEKLVFDEDVAVQYMWLGIGQERFGAILDAEGNWRSDYLTMRLCWRVRGSRREYTSCDRLDCLSLEGCTDIKKIMPLRWEDGEF